MIERNRAHRWQYATTTILLIGGAWACGPQRLAVVGPVANPAPVAERLVESTRLQAPTRIDFRWQLNEAGSRIGGLGVARIEPPYRARLDLFLDGGETVSAAVVVDDELRLPPGDVDEVFPPVDLMWATLGVFRPLAGAALLGGDRLENDSDRLRYRLADGREVHYEVAASALRTVELLEGESVIGWVRLTGDPAEGFPESATYRNLLEFRELQIVRLDVAAADSFDPAIWELGS